MVNEMKKILPGDPESMSQDNIKQNIQQLRSLFPEAWIEGKIDFDVLKQLLGGVVDEHEEKYGLNWHGKRNSRRLALTPSLGTLRPCLEDSIEWDTTQNLMIEGDNLEVLKLLQKSYAGKIKMIYVDPPYNTGHDFVYPDDFHDSIKNYQMLSGQIDSDGRKVTSNTETSGRFHTAWLNMILPRLKIAWTCLHRDGVLFISIHNRELANLLHVTNQLFGEENFVGLITWKARVKPVNLGEAKYRPQCETEYVAVYQRTDSERKFKPIYTGGMRSYPHVLDNRRYRLQTILKSNRGANFRNTMSFELRGYSPPEGQRWQGGEEEIHRLDSEGYIEFREGTPFRRYFEDEEGAEHDPFYCFMESDWTSTSEAGKFEVNVLLGENHGFDTVKPTRLIRTLIQSVTSPAEDSIVMDFFAGSGTTWHAVMAQNAADGGERRCILVQFPEPLDPENKDQRTAAAFCDRINKCRSIAEITKERLRRAGAAIKRDVPTFQGDIGFRVFKFDSSNINSWDPDSTDLDQMLLRSIEHIKFDRDEADVLYELLLKLGLDLCVPIEQQSIAKKVVYSVGAGILFVCLDPKISRADAEPLALGIIQWHKQLNPAAESSIVFRDSGFEDDVTKTNITAILQQQGLGNVRSL
jgi:adenine-specific DNA-methyltransferase